MKILSVDDKSENLYMLEALLRGYGHQVDSASDGRLALQLAASGQYDLIISDILMPKMDGFQLCRELKKDARLGQIPFVFYTATYTEPRDAAFALDLGADRFLVKPLEPEAFIKAIEEVLEQKARSEPRACLEATGEDEAIYLKEYNARLITKLEKKMLDLEAANHALIDDIAERERAARERARLEDKLRHAQKMEAIGTLAGGIAHDFNNILAGIIGFAELGLHEVSNPLSADQHFREILKAGKRARDLVRQILAFSRQREEDRQPLHLGETVKEALGLLRATLPVSIEIVAKIDEGIPTVLADSTQVHQIVTNLVTNAWHAIGQKPGIITVQLDNFQVDSDFAHANPDLRPGRYVRLSINDSGSGIPTELLGRIFEPFFTTKAPDEGTGLGLSVVHGLMKAFDGAITIYSNPGEGTTLHLYFPALEFGATAACPEELAEALGHGERILFVDDEPVLTMLGGRFLTRLGYLPITQSDPRAALALFKDQEFDAVITDLTMPHFSGIEFARCLWELRPETRVLLTTGYSATLDAGRARDLGFCQLLLKPYTVQALGEALQSALSLDGPAPRTRRVMRV
ncbi:MAG TPA: response regulator [Chthoniobacter sp.]|jgi:signal transduction histidine kinase